MSPLICPLSFSPGSFFLKTDFLLPVALISPQESPVIRSLPPFPVPGPPSQPLAPFPPHLAPISPQESPVIRSLPSFPVPGPLSSSSGPHFSSGVSCYPFPALPFLSLAPFPPHLAPISPQESPVIRSLPSFPVPGPLSASSGPHFSSGVSCYPFLPSFPVPGPLSTSSGPPFLLRSLLFSVPCPPSLSLAPFPPHLAPPFLLRSILLSIPCPPSLSLAPFPPHLAPLSEFSN